MREREAEQARNDIAQLQQLKHQEADHYKRAIEDIRITHEENIRKLMLRDEEVRLAHKEINELNDKSNHQSAEIEALKLVITELEEKNRKLSEKLNEIIFNKAAVYKQKTIEQLRRGGS